MEISLNRLAEIFSAAFGETIELTISTSKNSLEQWDSLGHLHLIVELEDQLNIQFTTSEIEQIINVEILIEILRQK
jgi:acyl carrier protein